MKFRFLRLMTFHWRGLAFTRVIAAATCDDSCLGGLTEEQPRHHPAATPVPCLSEPAPQTTFRRPRLKHPCPFASSANSTLPSRDQQRWCWLWPLEDCCYFTFTFKQFHCLQRYTAWCHIGLPTLLLSCSVFFLLLLYSVWAFGRLVLTYVRLRRNEQVRSEQSPATTASCSDSPRMQSVTATTSSRDVLKEYVIEYPKAEVEKTAPRHSAGVAAAAPPPRPPHASFFSRDQLSPLLLR